MEESRVNPAPYDFEEYRRRPHRYAINDQAGLFLTNGIYQLSTLPPLTQMILNLGLDTAYSEIKTGESFNYQNAFDSASKTFWARPKHVTSHLALVASLNGVADQQSQVCIGMGQKTTGGPFLGVQDFDLTAGIQPDSPIAKLYIRADTLAWECVTFSGRPGPAGERNVNALTVPAHVTGQTQRAEIIYSPGNFWSFRVDGVEGFRTVGAFALPNVAAAISAPIGGWVGCSTGASTIDDLECYALGFHMSEVGWE